MKRSEFVKKLAKMIAKVRLDWDVDAKTVYPSYFDATVKMAEAVADLIDSDAYWGDEED